MSEKPEFPASLDGVGDMVSWDSHSSHAKDVLSWAVAASLCGLGVVPEMRVLPGPSLTPTMTCWPPKIFELTTLHQGGQEEATVFVWSPQRIGFL